MAKYRPGELDQRIEIIRQVRTDDGRGGHNRTEVVQYTLWALVIVKGGAEVFKYEKVDAVAVYTFVVRNTKSLVINDTDFIKWDGVKYNIRSPLKKSPRKMYLEIEAERGIAQ
mgnify:CR=1 FL=1